MPDRTYKTEWCRLFVRNHACNHGDECRHVHYSWEKRPKPPAARRFKRVWHTYTWANGWVDWHYTVEPCDPADDPPEFSEADAPVAELRTMRANQNGMLPTGEHRKRYIYMMWHILAADYCEVRDMVSREFLWPTEDASPEVIAAVDDTPNIQDAFNALEAAAAQYWMTHPPPGHRQCWGSACPLCYPSAPAPAVAAFGE